MSRLKELYEKMADEAPVSFHPTQRAYIMELVEIYATECCKASLEKAKKDLYNYWIFFEEGKENEPEFTIYSDDFGKVYNKAYDFYGPQVKDLYYRSLGPEESITNPENIILL